MIPAGLLSSDALGAIDTAKNTAVSAVQSQQTTSVNAVTSAGTAAAANFPATAAACDTLAGDFAATYVPDQAYAVGDYCTYQYQLYQCKTAIAANTDHTFVTSHWNLITVTDTINDQVDDLKTQLNLSRITLDKPNKYYDTSGDTIDPTGFASSSLFNCAAISCTPGEKFSIHAAGRTSASLPYAFIDSSNNVIQKASYIEVNEFVEAPANAQYLIINNLIKRTDCISYFGESITTQTDILKTLENNNEINIGIIGDPDGNQINYDINHPETYPLGFRSGYFIDTTGESSASGNFARTATNLPITEEMYSVTIIPQTDNDCYIVAFSDRLPLYDNGGDNSSRYVWGAKFTEPYTFTPNAGEYYYVSVHEKFSTLTSQQIPLFKAYSESGKRILALEASVDSLDGRVDILEENDVTTRGKVETLEGDNTKNKRNITESADNFSFLIEGNVDNYDTGHYVVNYNETTGMPYAVLTVTNNYKTTPMYPCKKGGKIKLDCSTIGAGELTFFDTENDLTSIVWQTRSALSSGKVYTLDAYGNYFTISKNSSKLTLPPIYISNKGYGFIPVTQFASNELNLYDSVMADIDDKTIVFSSLADSHFTEYQSRGYRVRQLTADFVKISENIGVDFMLHLGDMIDQYYFLAEPSGVKVPVNELHLKEMMQIFKESSLPFVYTQGHHELYPLVASGNGNNEWGFSRGRCFGLCGRYTQYLNPVYHDGSSSFYIDFDLPKVRLIVLDSCSYGANGFSSAVITWFENALDNAPDGYKVIMVSHCATVQYGDVSVTNGDKIEEKALAYMANGGTILCHIHGHYHMDNYNIITDGTYSYPLISQGCATVEAHDTGMQYMSNFTPASPRTVYDVSEHLFDIYCIHTDTNIVKTFRFGAGSNKTINLGN